MKEYHRTDRIADLIWHTLANLLKKNVKDPRLATINITQVKVSKDLSHAKIYFSVLKKESLPESLKALKKASGFLRYELAQEVDLRITPELKFIYDEGAEESIRLVNLIEQTIKKQKPSEE